MFQQYLIRFLTKAFARPLADAPVENADHGQPPLPLSFSPSDV
jgi:hypothetical protein